LVINVAKDVGYCFTYEQGLRLQEIIRTALKKEPRVSVSLKDVSTVTSSFVNGAFMPLINDYGIDGMRRHVVVCDSTRAINDVIRRCMQKESSSATEHSAAKEPCLVS